MANQMQINRKQSRNSSMELLRIIAMLFIVLSHACAHSKFGYADSAMSFNKLFVQWGILGNLGVDIYALVSGYFLCKKEKSYQSIIRLLLQVWFYSYTLFIICRFGFHVSYSVKDYVRVFLPTIFQEYWFFTVYIVLSLLYPYVNIFLAKADQKTLRGLIAIMFLLWVIIPTFTLQEMYSSPLAQLLFFYLVGAYFRLYPDKVIRNKTMIVCLTAASFFLLFLSTFVCNYLGESIGLFKNIGRQFYSRDSLLIVACAIGLFAYFVNIPAFTNRAINTVSACTFGVYLIHDNPAVRNLIWLRLFRHAERFDSIYLAAHIIASVFLVFCVSALIEYLRIRIFGKYIDRISIYIEEKFKQYCP